MGKVKRSIWVLYERYGKGDYRATRQIYMTRDAALHSLIDYRRRMPSRKLFVVKYFADDVLVTNDTKIEIIEDYENSC